LVSRERLAGNARDDGIRRKRDCTRYTETEFERESPRTLKEVLRAIVANRCINELKTPEDLAGAIVFFASDDSDFITGQTILVDGGSAMS